MSDIDLDRCEKFEGGAVNGYVIGYTCAANSRLPWYVRVQQDITAFVGADHKIQPSQKQRIIAKFRNNAASEGKFFVVRWGIRDGDEECEEHVYLSDDFDRSRYDFDSIQRIVDTLVGNGFPMVLEESQFTHDEISYFEGKHAGRHSEGLIHLSAQPNLLVSLMSWLVRPLLRLFS